MSVDIAVINCPVCQYQDIKGNICPNCDTDISLIRALINLTIVEKKKQIITGSTKNQSKVFFVIFLAAVFGFLAGTWFSYWSFSGMNSIMTITQAPVEQPIDKIISVETDSEILNKSQVEQEAAKIYQVKNGDSLFQVAEKLCGDSTKWKKFVMSNETLVEREGYLLNTSETLVIPVECQSI
jgi:hypothetical protein